MKILFRAENMHKANLHCHTTISDGKHTPKEVKAIYQEKGYGIIAFTDHNEWACQNDLSDENFLAINGCEASVSARGSNSNRLRKYHFNLYATKSDMPAAN